MGDAEKKILQERVERKEKQLSQAAVLFQMDTRNIESGTYESSAISALLEVQKLKAEIAELQFVLQLLLRNEGAVV